MAAAAQSAKALAAARAARRARVTAAAAAAAAAGAVVVQPCKASSEQQTFGIDTICNGSIVQQYDASSSLRGAKSCSGSGSGNGNGSSTNTSSHSSGSSSSSRSRSSKGKKRNAHAAAAGTRLYSSSKRPRSAAAGGQPLLYAAWHPGIPVAPRAAAQRALAAAQAHRASLLAPGRLTILRVRRMQH
jgi:hypothetical protein